jgi:TPR repeat protein
MLDAPTSKIDVQFAPDFLINLGRDTDAPRLRDRFKAGRNVDTVPGDDAKAVFWFRKAAEQGDVWAQYNFGWMYDHGEAVPDDAWRAVSPESRFLPASRNSFDQL